MSLTWNSPAARCTAVASALALATAAYLCPAQKGWVLHIVSSVLLVGLGLARECQNERCSRLFHKAATARAQAVALKTEVVALGTSLAKIDEQTASVVNDRRRLLQESSASAWHMIAKMRSERKEPDANETAQLADALVRNRDRVRSLRRVVEALAVCLQWSTCGMASDGRSASPTPRATRTNGWKRAGSIDASSSIPQVASVCQRTRTRSEPVFQRAHSLSSPTSADVASESHASPWTSTPAFTAGTANESQRSPRVIIESL